MTAPRLDPTPPAWAARTWDWTAKDPGEVLHDGRPVTLTAPDGETVATASLSLIMESGYDAETTMTVSGGGFASFAVAHTADFTRALRAWADELDAEAAKVGGAL